MAEHDIEKDAEVNKEVKVEEIDGLKRVTVITKEGGKETVEVFEGPDADKKLMELESEGSAPKVRKEKRIKNEPVIREKSNMQASFQDSEPPQNRGGFFIFGS